MTVNLNTAELIARLVFSLRRVLEPGLVEVIVVVDNGSTDRSLELLEPLEEAGVVSLVQNRRRPYHGTGLNRGLSFLARAQRRGSAVTDLVWVLDSDVVVLREDALRASLAVMRATAAAMLGQQQPYDQPRPRLDRYAHPAALLVDPALVWRHSVPAFLEDGAPAVMMQHVLRRRGFVIADFPYFTDGYLLHVGSGTLDALVRDHQVHNRYFSWATEHSRAHYHGNPSGKQLRKEFEARFRAEVPELTADRLVAACTVRHED